MGIRIKNTIKKCLTYLWHPYISAYLLSTGIKDFYIAPQMTINKCRFLHVGEGLSIGRNARFLFIKSYKGGIYDPKVNIGCNVSIGNRFSLLCAAPIEIGDNCLIASDVLITSENHGMDVEGYDSYSQTQLIAAPVSIGDGCWIGEKACILPGVELGRRCVVAAGAVVTKTIPPYTLVAGVPAKVIKVYDFDMHRWVTHN